MSRFDNPFPTYANEPRHHLWHLGGNVLIAPPPAECVKCFAEEPAHTRTPAGYECRCPSCGHQWFEETPRADGRLSGRGFRSAGR